MNQELVAEILALPASERMLLVEAIWDSIAAAPATATRPVDEIPAPAPASDAEFEADMQAFAEGTEHLPAYSGTYSRADIYFDHD